MHPLTCPSLARSFSPTKARLLDGGTFVHTKIATFFLFLLLLGPVLQAQSDPDLLERIAELERAARARETRIRNLESQLRDTVTETDAPRLEEFLQDLQATLDHPPNLVGPTRSERISIGGQLRLRGEFRDVTSYSADEVADSADFIVQRTRIHFDFDLDRRSRVFVQLQDSRLWGEEGRGLRDLEGVDIHQAYLELRELFGGPVSLRVGRQELDYGDRRLISPLDWSPVGNAFDALKIWWEDENFRLDLFAALLTEGSLPLGSGAGRDDYFSGLYFTWRGVEHHEFDAFAFYRSIETEGVFDESGSSGDARDLTFGIRAAGTTGALDYSAEFAAQIGSRAGDEVEAYAWALTLGYTVPEWANLRIGLEWTFATGDDDPGDGTFGTFDPLFAFIHAYQGYLDIFAWQNGHDLALHLDCDLAPQFRVGVSTHAFLLDSDRDAWFRSNGTPLRRVNGGVGNFVGVELDLHVRMRLAASRFLWFGYSHFFAGDYVRDTGASPDTDWLFIQLTENF